MAKAPTLPTITGQFASSGQLNQAFRDIEDAFDNTLSLDGSTPNALQGDLDLNGNSLLNVDTIDVDNLSVAGLTVTDLASVPEWRGAWAGATAYVKNDLVKINGNVYIALEPHVSGTFTTDLSALKWELFVERGAAGAGTGDVVASNNLSELTNKPLALSTIGGQPLDALLTDISDLTDPNADRLLFWDDSASEITWLSLGSGLTITGTTIEAGGVPPGAVMAFAMDSPPTGWLKANGALVSRTTYASLFANIGTTYGAGDGVSTFALPDLRGEFVRGWADDRTVDTGRAFGSAQTDDNKSHTHAVTDPGHNHTLQIFSPTTGSSGLGGDGVTSRNDTHNLNAQWQNVSQTGANGDMRNLSSTTGITLGTSGGTEARPRNIALLYCIKT